VHQAQALSHPFGNFLLAHAGVTAQGESNVVEHVHGVKERPLLEGHAELPADGQAPLGFGAGEVLAVHDNVPAVRLHQTNEMLQKHAFPGPGTAHDD
jgi:hypothetical protein